VVRLNRNQRQSRAEERVLGRNVVHPGGNVQSRGGGGGGGGGGGKRGGGGGGGREEERAEREQAAISQPTTERDCTAGRG